MEGKGGVKVQHCDGVMLACIGLKWYVAEGRKEENTKIERKKRSGS
jgi:hypothetical protein